MYQGGEGGHRALTSKVQNETFVIVTGLDWHFNLKLGSQQQTRINMLEYTWPACVRDIELGSLVPVDSF